MRVFLTGATGFIGSAIIPELLAAGHEVLGMARSDSGASQLTAAGAQVHRGDLTDLDSLRAGAAAADGVIHCAFIHDFSNFAENCEIDRRAIEALGAAIEGTNKPLIITSGTGMVRSGNGKPATEDDAPSSQFPRVESEKAALALAARGLNVSIMRLPQVHDTRKAGLVSYIIPIARQKGVCAYVGDGSNRWPAAHVSDVARLYRLALEKAQPGACYHASAEEGVPMREIAEALGRGMNLPAVSISPEEAASHFGWLGAFAAVDLPASSVLTRQRLGWNPTGPTLLADLAQMQF